MDEIGKALKSIFDKLSDFFDIFDLSFFVSGSVITILIMYWLGLRDLYVFNYFEQSGTLIIFIIICYTNGLIAFAIGRWIRMGIWSYFKSKIYKVDNRFDLFDLNFIRILKAHSLDKDEEISSYLNNTDDRGTWRLYVKFWAMIREDEKYNRSLSVLKRYWVMAATYDGLSILMFISLIINFDLGLGFTGDIILSFYGCASICVILLIALLACVREADRYLEYQVEEVVATIANNK